MVLGFWDIAVPIVGAPMAGGPGTPALAAAVSNAGGLGFVAGGYRTADQFADDISAARAATTGPIGANIFVPQPSVADWLQLEYYAEELAEVAEYYHVEVGQPIHGDDDEWERKLEVVADIRPELVSFTFGAPPPDVVRQLSALGLLVSVTVTSAYEAGVAIAAGADNLVVQGPGAGRASRYVRAGYGAGRGVPAPTTRSHRPYPRCAADRGGRSWYRRRSGSRAAQGSGCCTGGDGVVAC